MINFLKNFIKIISFNLLFLFAFIFIIEIIFGYWFDKDNFGAVMREHRMKNQKTEWKTDDESVTYFYRRNYYGFRGKDIKPSEIKGLIFGGSVIDERYKPDKYTITGFLNQKLKNKNVDLLITNAGIEGQSTVGLIYGFYNWLFKIKDLSPDYILFYLGINDTAISGDLKLENMIPGGHIINPDKKEVFLDNIRSRSILYDSARIFKFKYLPRKNFVKYDGNVHSEYRKKFSFISHKEALNNYNFKELKFKYSKQIKSYLERVDLLNDLSKELKSEVIFITNIASWGHTEILYALNTSLIEHCKNKKYHCIDVATKLDGDINYWRDGTHTTKLGSEKVADLIMKDLMPILNTKN